MPTPSNQTIQPTQTPILPNTTRPESGADFTDRRQFLRRPEVRACKLFHAPSQRFLGGRTRDLSEGGALVEIELGRPVAPGDAIELLMPPPAAAMIPAALGRAARVVRVMNLNNGKQGVALQLVQTPT